MAKRDYMAWRTKDPGYDALKNLGIGLVKSEINPAVTPQNIAHVVHNYENGDFVWPCLMYNAGVPDNKAYWMHLLKDTFLTLDTKLKSFQKSLSDSLVLICEPDENIFDLVKSPYQFFEDLIDAGVELSAYLQERLSVEPSITKNHIANLLDSILRNEPTTVIDIDRDELIAELEQNSKWLFPAVDYLETRVQAIRDSL